MRAPSGGR